MAKSEKISEIVDVLDNKTILTEREKKLIRENNLTINYATNNKLIISLNKTRAFKLIRDNKNSKIKIFTGTLECVDNHCINYPHNVTLTPYDTISRALNATIKLLKSEEDLVKKPVIEDIKSEITE